MAIYTCYKKITPLLISLENTNVDGNSNIICENAVSEPLIDMQISGNSIQDGTPTPEAPVEVQSVGDKTSNIFDMTQFAGKSASLGDSKIWIAEDGSLHGEGTPTGYFSIIETLKPKWSGVLTLSLYGEYTNLCYQIMFRDSSNNILFNVTLSDNYSNKSTTVNMADYPTFDHMILDMKRTEDNNPMSGWAYLKVEQANTVTEYEPYGYKVPVKVNDTNYNIYLKEPLRKIGDNADYLDYKNKKVVRNIKAFELKGTEAYGLGSTNDASQKRIYITTTGAKKVEYNEISTLCTHYKAVIPVETYECVTGCSGYDNQNVCAIFDENHQTVEDFNAFTKEQYDNGTPVIIYSLLETPTEETIDIPEINTITGTNVFDIGTKINPTVLSVNYTKRRIINGRIS